MPSAGKILKKATERQPQLPVWITHMWQRRTEHSRLGLVLGAGVTRDAGIPMWEELVTRLTKAAGMPEERMRLHKKARYPETFLAEILFRKHFADQKSAKVDRESFRIYYVNSTWKEKIRTCLYRDVRN